MSQENISLVNKNDNESLKDQIKSNKNEVVNCLDDKAYSKKKYYELLSNKLELGERSGFALKQTREEMLAEFKRDFEKTTATFVE